MPERHQRCHHQLQEQQHPRLLQGGELRADTSQTTEIAAPGTRQDTLQQTEEGLDRDVEQTDWHTLSPAFDSHPVHVV